MKGAFLVSEESNLPTSFWLLCGLSAQRPPDGVAQLPDKRCRLFTVFAVNLEDARIYIDVMGALNKVLEFPSWCGSSWDSIQDAFPELREAWSFPLAIAVVGLPKLLVERPYLVRNTVSG